MNGFQENTGRDRFFGMFVENPPDANPDKEIPNIQDFYGSRWVGPGLTRIFVWKIFQK